MSTLRKRLDAVPPDLVSFFVHLINSVPEIYHQLMARYFKMATAAEEPLSAIAYSSLDDLEDDPNSALSLHWQTMHQWEINARLHHMRRRLDGRPKGLLELVIWDDDDDVMLNYKINPFFDVRVDFFHRTVRDFLLDSAETASTLQARLQGENFPLVACNTFLAEIKLAPHTHRDMTLSISQLFAAASEASTNHESCNALETVLRSADEAYQSACQKYHWTYSERYFLGMAAQIGFLPFLRTRVLAKPAILQPSHTSAVAMRPLLDYALNPQHKVNQFSIQTIKFLLEQGADPNERLRNTTVWGGFLATMVVDRFVLDKEATFDAVKLLLRNGASRTVLVKPAHNHDIRTIKRIQQKAKQLSASDALASAFGPKVIDQLFLVIYGKEVRDSSLALRPKADVRCPELDARHSGLDARRPELDVRRGVEGSSYQYPLVNRQPRVLLVSSIETSNKLREKKKRPWYRAIFR
ncbi:hypothetical protein F5Y19DRAFT_241360 [Xylariaceae sp. FL1651]|nr:hypothetical protein F5Y19DRAFT_241360 [Xylariaceae sp. FL1651]